MSRGRKIVVEALIPAPVDVVWERTQTPDLHTAWDIRFTHIAYLPRTDERGYKLMDYRTDVAFGIEVKGVGRYLHSKPLVHSSFEFDSDDWKSIIRAGRGIWQYEPRPGGTYFKTVYDYSQRHGIVGRLLDYVVFRRLLQHATEWGFETLRRWCAGDATACVRRRSRWRFLVFHVLRRLGMPPARGAAASWLGTGQETRLGSTAVATVAR